MIMLAAAGHQLHPDLPLTVEGVAQIAHEANRALCMASGDHSQLPWHLAPEWQKESAVLGVVKTLSGEIVTPEDSHVSWAAQKLADGWTYGPVKDEVAKTHPCLVDHAELPPQQQVKDYIFHAVVSAILGFISSKLGKKGGVLNIPGVTPFNPHAPAVTPTDPSKGATDDSSAVIGDGKI